MYLRKRGIRFVQQAAIGRFIVDFLVPPNIVVEAEGKVHSSTQKQDAQRTEELENRGYRVFRVPNYFIFADPASVADMVKQQCNCQPNDDQRKLLVASVG